MPAVFTPTCDFVCSIFDVCRENGCQGGSLTPIPVGEKRNYCGVALPPVGNHGTECYRCEKCKYRVELSYKEDEINSHIFNVFGINSRLVENVKIKCSFICESQRLEEECLSRLDDDPDYDRYGVLCDCSDEYMANGEPDQITFIPY